LLRRPKIHKNSRATDLKLPDGTYSQNYSLEKDKQANPEWWASLMSLRNTASFISQYIYNVGLMDKLKKIEDPDPVAVMHEACLFFMEYDSRTGLPGVCYTIGAPVPGSPHSEYYKGPGMEDVEWVTPTLPGADGPMGHDMEPMPDYTDGDKDPDGFWEKRPKIYWETHKELVLNEALKLYPVKRATYKPGWDRPDLQEDAEA
jgi:hypothetical protein